MELLGDMCHLESHFVLFGEDVSFGAPRLRDSSGAHLERLEIVLILTQDRCTVCVERTIGSEIDFDAPNGTPK
jgi:hypothetical protein